MFIQIYEGEQPFTKDTIFIGGFELTGIRPAPHGTPEIEVTLEIDGDGLLSAAAVDKGTQVASHLLCTCHLTPPL